MEYEAVRMPGGYPYMECAPGLWFPEQVMVWGPAPGLERASDHPTTAYRIEARFFLFSTFLKYACDSLHLHIDGILDVEDQTLLKAETYRSLRLAEIQQGLGDELGVLTEEMSSDELEMETLPYRDKEGHQLDDELVRAARAYVRGVLSGRRAQKDVSEQLGVSIATAGRRVKAAREAGYLPPDGRMFGPTLRGIE